MKALIASYKGKFYDTIDVNGGVPWLISSHYHDGFKAEGNYMYYYRKMTLEDIENTTFKCGEMPLEKPTFDDRVRYMALMGNFERRLQSLGADGIDALFDSMQQKARQN